MVILLPMLMAYSLIGETFHEVIGVVMFVLIIFHNWLNHGFWKGLFKGKYSSQRVFRTIINIALLIMMLLQPLSGIMVSKHLFIFTPELGVSFAARQVHLVIAYWFFVLMSVHAGTHLSLFTAKIGKRTKKPVKVICSIICLGVCVYGSYAFVKRKLLDYMFMNTSFVFFDFSELKIYFFIDYIAIMILFTLIGYIFITGLQCIDLKKTNRFL